MKSIRYTIQLNFDDKGIIDAAYIADAIEYAIYKTIGEGVLTPDIENHAQLLEHTIGLAEVVE